ncbi:hypothetical protein G7Y89_g10017 [Cudoniella acicularis]|uniref:FAD-binding PCMH-type domain-containing protein n=1 Tax=Cudoniella acicularis TaxID=354080 RepID=A0A8H4VZL3_9HELO|nr:hypothetical protein G7Y89_g10017 [Cudoniella acicularis]
MASSSILKATLLASVIGITISSSLAGNLTEDLQLRLSTVAQVYYPGSVGYTNATSRWSTAIQPGLDVVVKVASEEDVQLTIQYANSYNVPFLAIGGGHGTSSALNSIQGGIGIWLRGLIGVEIAAGNNGSEAVIQAGMLSGEVVQDLWDLGKMTVTGGCYCTGFSSPMLGGGHGWLQGQYGLMTDNLLSARLVLANGTAITVSDTQHSDLFWGLRGAGHNFGIVTSALYSIYDRTPELDGFATAAFTFTQDKLEDVFAIANGWLEAQNRPVELTHYGTIVINPAIDSKPVIEFLVYWQGTSIPEEYTDPLKALKPVSVVEEWVDLVDASVNTGASADGPACALGSGRQTFPVELYQWDLNNLRTVLDIYATLPAALNGSVVLLEGYATNRVIEIPQESTAYANRESRLLASPLFTYPANASLGQTVFEIGKQVRSAFLNGTGLPLSAYVNYANGDESQQAVYGYELWRLQRLKGLKETYDPQGKFNFFEPIKV